MAKHVDTKFEGVPCHKGCGTTRYKRNNACIVCRSTRQARKKTPKYTQENNRLLRTYGIDLDRRSAVLELQGFVCGICGKTEDENGARLCIDHDHDTHVIRGLLCYNCNRALGYFDDNIETVRRAMIYLTAHKTALCANK